MTLVGSRVGTRMGWALAGFATVLAMGPRAGAQAATATVHGHVINPAGQPVNAGQVKFTTDLTTPFKDEKFSNTVDIKNGDYTAPDVKPGDYFIYVIEDGKTLDRMQETIKAGDNKTVDFDMTREEYMKSLSPEERKTIEEYKAKNAAAVANNKNVANLNATMLAVRADLKTATPNYDKDVADSKAALDTRPTEPLLWVLYGDTLTAKADGAAAADRANKTSPTTDDAVSGGYTAAIAAYQKAADLLAAQPKPNPGVEGTVYNEMGNANAKAGKLTEASAAYDKAAGFEPASAGKFYANEAAVFFNAHQDQSALDAANKAIATDPTIPLPYYIKGQTLLAKSTVDPKTQKIVAPPGCVEAYQKYLELAPDGAQAPAVKDALGALGEKIETRYSARKGH